MKTMRARLPAILFLWGFLLGIPFYHIPTFTKGPLICALIGQEKNVFEIFTQPHLWTYRPLLVLMFSTLYKLFGFHYEPYRIFASLFSGFFAVFVYLFLLELHPSRKIAFFATIIFTLTTPFLDGLWDLSEGGFYSTCLFYGAFLFFVKLSKCDGNHKLENRYTFLFLLFSLLSLLIKETTRAMAPPILFLYCYFLKANKTQWKLFWIFCALSVLTLLPVLSAPPEPGSRAAVTTPFWEVAKIAFQINVTQLMSIFHFAAVIIILFHSISMIQSKWWKNFSFIFIFIAFFAYSKYGISFGRPLEYVTYFSAKYFPESAFNTFNFFGLLLLIAYIIIVKYGNPAQKFSSSSIAMIFFSYYIEMTLIPIFRLEPSSRHYLIVLPLLCILVIQSIVSVHEELQWQGSMASVPATLFSFLIGWHLCVSAFNLGSEFNAIGKVEFSSWQFVSEQGLNDTLVFSPADGYALPQEYLKLSNTQNARYAFFQLPRWFETERDFDAHLSHTINDRSLQNTRKYFYYSRYGTPLRTQRTFRRCIIYRFPDPGSPYTKIGYWQHIFALQSLERFSSTLEGYVKNNATVVYERQQTFFHLHEYFGELLKYVSSDTTNSLKIKKSYFAQIYIQDNEPKPK